MTVGVIVQSRMGSTRLPGKVLLPLGGKPSIIRVLERASQISGIDRVIVATTTLRQDLQLVDVVRSAGYEAVMPTATPDNVLSRYYWTAKQFKFDTIVRITGDCPLLDPAVSSRVVGVSESGRWDYVSNRQPATFPDGFDTEVFDFDTLERTYKQASDNYSREHVTPYINQSKEFTVQNVWNTKDQSMIRLTLDTHEDYDYIKYVYDELGDNPRTKDILELPRQRIVDRV